jgi:hypothetical protein
LASRNLEIETCKERQNSFGNIGISKSATLTRVLRKELPERLIRGNLHDAPTREGAPLLEV